MTALLERTEPASPSNAKQSDSAVHRSEGSFDVFKMLREFVNPLYFTVGCALAFLSCCAYGFACSAANPFQNFHRFHQLLSPETLFYPTIHQLRSLALSKVRPDQTLVIIGGNSIFNGVGQTEEQLWSDELQRLLGPEYAVRNLSFRGSSPFDGAYVAAETLIKDHPKLLFITVTAPSACGVAEGAQPYAYFYWDANAEGLLQDDIARSKAVQSRIDRTSDREHTSIEEQMIHSFLNRHFRFDDAWGTIGYQNLFTVWNYWTDKHFIEPRKEFRDPETAPLPVAERFGNIETEMKIVRSFSETHYKKNERGAWVKVESPWRALETYLQTIIPLQMRDRCLVVFPRNCPFYLKKLTIDEKLRDDLLYIDAVSTWTQSGFEAMEVGKGFVEEDYKDRAHIASPGGRKLAYCLQQRIKQLAAQRGFVK